MNIKLLENTKFFKTQDLKAGELLYDEGEVNNFLYIIKSGKISIEKYIGDERLEAKKLAILGEGEIFGEGSLSNNAPKQVKVVALEDSVLLKIEGGKDFENFLIENPKLGIELLSEVIVSSNKRLLESNFLVTSSYSLIKKISEIGEFNNKNLFLIIDALVSIISADYIIYIEKNPVLENIFISRYDTRFPGKMQDKILETDEMINLQELGFKKEDSTLVEALKIGNKVIGYLIIGRTIPFDDGQKKSIRTIAVSIAGFIKQKQNIEGERK